MFRSLQFLRSRRIIAGLLEENEQFFIFTKKHGTPHQSTTAIKKSKIRRQ